MIKIVAILLVLVLIPAAALGYLYSQKEALLLNKIKAHLKELTGTEPLVENLHIQKMEGLSRWTVTFEKIVLHNPSSFKNPDLAILQKTELIFEPLPLLQGQWKIQKISTLLQKIYLEVNDQGVLNLTELPAIKAVGTPRVTSKNFWAESVELRYGKVYQGTQVHKLNKKREVLSRINHGDVLIQAPVLSLINELNQGSLGLPRGKLQEQIRQHVGVVTPAA